MSNRWSMTSWEDLFRELTTGEPAAYKEIGGGPRDFGPNYKQQELQHRLAATKPSIHTPDGKVVEVEPGSKQDSFSYNIPDAQQYSNVAVDKASQPPYENLFQIPQGVPQEIPTKEAFTGEGLGIANKIPELSTDKNPFSPLEKPKSTVYDTRNKRTGGAKVISRSQRQLLEKGQNVAGIDVTEEWKDKINTYKKATEQLNFKSAVELGSEYSSKEITKGEGSFSRQMEEDKNPTDDGANTDTQNPENDKDSRNEAKDKKAKDDTKVPKAAGEFNLSESLESAKKLFEEEKRNILAQSYYKGHQHWG